MPHLQILECGWYHTPNNGYNYPDVERRHYLAKMFNYTVNSTNQPKFYITHEETAAVEKTGFKQITVPQPNGKDCGPSRHPNLQSPQEVGHLRAES